MFMQRIKEWTNDLIVGLAFGSPFWVAVIVDHFVNR